MSGRPGNTNTRRSSAEIVYAILKFLEENDTSVKLNDIAVEIGSNTKLVQRWLKIIRDIQLKPDVTFEDKRGPKIRLLDNGNNLSSDEKFGIYTFDPANELKLYLQEWIEESNSKQSSIFSGTWKLVDNFENSQLVIYDRNKLRIGDPSNLLRKPALVVDEVNGLNITLRESFFYVMGWITTPTLDSGQNRGITSLDILSLLSNNLISGIFTEAETSHLQELLPLLLTDVGLIIFDESLNIDEVVIFIQVVANIIDNRVNETNRIQTKSNFWCTLRPHEQNKLIETRIGRLIVSKINYCLLNPTSYTKWPESRYEFKEYHIWEVITQIELGHLQRNSIEVQNCLFYLDANSNSINDTLYNFIAHLIILEPKPQIDENKIDELPIFYKLLRQINPILLNMNYVSNWNWNDLGKLISYYNQLDLYHQPIMKLLLSRKTNQYVSKKEVKIIHDYQLIKDYFNLNIKDFPPDSVINILTWNLNSGDLSNSVDLINFLLEKNYNFNFDTIKLCHLSLTYSMNFEMTTLLFALHKDLLNKRLLNRKFESNLKISNFLLRILGEQYDELHEDDLQFYVNALQLVVTDITPFQIKGLQILYDYFAQIYQDTETNLRNIKLRGRKLLMDLINQSENQIIEVGDYKLLLNKIVDLNFDYVHDDLFIYTYMICISYLLSIQRESNSYLRDKLRSTRRVLENKLEKLDITSYGAFAKLILVAVKNLEEMNEEEELLKIYFPGLLKSYSIEKLLRFLFIRYLIRSRTLVS